MSEQATGDESREIRVVTYNIHRCIGTDGERDPQRIAQVLCDLEPDIVALQEVDTSLDTRTYLGQLHTLARSTGLDPIAGPTLERDDGFYGNAMLARFPVIDQRRCDLSVEGFEPRGALDVEFDVGGRTLRVVGTHLGLNAGERRTQIGRLLSVLYRSPRGQAAVVMGDFNEWFGWSRNLRRLNSHLGFQPRLSTFPSRRPVFGLDRVWATPKSVLVAAGVELSELARTASDHLPLRASLRLKSRSVGQSARRGD
jgi:endonuclease/exonuclease/phosphatase family metal-dependent hydrolase